MVPVLLLSLLLSPVAWAQDTGIDEEIPPEEPRLDEDFSEEDDYEFEAEEEGKKTRN